MRIQRTLCAHTFKVKQHFGYSRSAANSTKFIYSQKIISNDHRQNSNGFVEVRFVCRLSRFYCVYITDSLL